MYNEIRALKFSLNSTGTVAVTADGASLGVLGPIKLRATAEGADVLRLTYSSPETTLLYITGNGDEQPLEIGIGMAGNGRLTLNDNGLLLEDVDFFTKGMAIRAYTSDLSSGSCSIDPIYGLRMAGTSTTWEDEKVSGMNMKTTGTANIPDVAVFRRDAGGTSGGVKAYAFDAGTMEQLSFDAQLRHSYKAGSAIQAHVHWSPGASTNTGTVVWGLEYTWQSIEGVFPVTVSTLAMADAADGVAYKHQVSPAATLSDAGRGISSVLMCRIFRDAANVADTFTGDAYLLSVDFHIEMDKFGSTGATGDV